MMVHPAKEAPTPKERDVTHLVSKSISLTLFEFNDFISIRSGHCTGTVRERPDENPG